MPGARDGHSVLLSWVLGSAGCALAAVAAHVCHSNSVAANFFLLLSAVCTMQLLVLGATCFSYRYWTVTSTSAPRLGPGQHAWPHVRSGLPAVKSSSKSAGLDAWSVLVISLLVAPILVPALTFHRPSVKLRFTAAQQAQKGIARASKQDGHRNGGDRYAVGAYEAIQLSIQAKVPGPGGMITMTNTASSAIDVDHNRAYVPSHVDATCMYPEVTAQNVTSLVGTYACNYTKAAGGICDGVAVGKGFGCVEVRKSNDSAVNHYMWVTYNDARVLCNVTYSLARVDVSWRGDDEGFPAPGKARTCRIARLSLREDIARTGVEWEQPDTSYSDLLNDTFMQPLSLPLLNAFLHTVSQEAVIKSNSESVDDFYGSIFAAATMLRGTGVRFDPTKSNQKVEVRFASAVCHQYGWSGAIIFLLVANVMLACGCTIISLGMRQQGAGIQEVLGSLLFCRKSTADDPQQPHDVRVPIPAGIVNSMTSIRTSQSSQQLSHSPAPAVGPNVNGR